MKLGKDHRKSERETERMNGWKSTIPPGTIALFSKIGTYIYFFKFWSHTLYTYSRCLFSSHFSSCFFLNFPSTRTWSWWNYLFNVSISVTGHATKRPFLHDIHTCLVVFARSSGQIFGSIGILLINLSPPLARRD